MSVIDIGAVYYDNVKTKGINKMKETPIEMFIELGWFTENDIGKMALTCLLKIQRRHMKIL